MNQSIKNLQSFDISEEAKDINALITQAISAEINLNEGVIPFSQFMKMALYEPKVGYYQNNLHKFGEKGDFITAPEMGENFAKCLANSICDYFHKAAATHENEQATKRETEQDAKILEIGAGSGILAVNLLSELARLNACPKQYLILEPSAQLQNQQKTLLKETHPHYFSNIVWLNQLPENFKGIVIANEVVDAIPCERITKVEGEWYQLGVALKSGDASKSGVASKNNEFQYSVMNKLVAEQIPKALCEQVIDDGYLTEYRPLAKGWIKALANSLESGAVILIDYGYGEQEFYHPQRNQGTLTCFISHHSHSDALQYVGLQDITAHVDFTQVAQTAFDAGLSIEGFTSQAGFLLENGITEINEEKAMNESPEQRIKRSRELQQLLMPGQMGEVIKVICLSKKLETEIKGFTLQDHLHRL